MWIRQAYSRDPGSQLHGLFMLVGERVVSRVFRTGYRTEEKSHWSRQDCRRGLDTRHNLLYSVVITATMLGEYSDCGWQTSQWSTRAQWAWHGPAARSDGDHWPARGSGMFTWHTHPGDNWWGVDVGRLYLWLCLLRGLLVNIITDDN